MQKKTADKRPWKMIVLVAGIFIVDLVMLVATRDSYSSFNEFFDNLAWIIIGLIFASVGGLILIRQPRHIIGWLLMGLPIANTISVITDFFLRESTLNSSQLDFWGFFYLWFNSWSWWLLIGPLLLIFLLFPTGRLISKRWRWVLYALGAAFFIFMFIATFAGEAETLEETGPIWTNPIGFLSNEIVESLIGAMSVLLLISVLSSVASIFVRYRKAQAVERAQMRWLFIAGILFMLIYVPQFILDNDSVGYGFLFLIGVTSIPVSIGIAILRYRLWDIDLVINRSLVYAVLTTLLAAIFAATAALLTQVAKAIFESEMQQAVAAVAAIFVASIFQPLRAWVETGINRRLFPENIDLSQGLIEINPDFWNWVGLPKILAATLDHLQDIYACDVAAVYLKKGTEYKPIAVVGLPKISLKSFQPNESERNSLEHKKGVIHENEKPFIVTIPIYLARRKAPELLGVLRLGKRKQGRGYSGDDIKTLVSFGAKLGQAVYALTSK